MIKMTNQIGTNMAREFYVQSILSTYQEFQSSTDGGHSAEFGDQIRVHYGFDVKRKGRETEADVCCRGVRIKQDGHARTFERNIDAPTKAKDGKNFAYVGSDGVYRDGSAYVDEIAGIEGMWDSRIELGRTSSE
jgi:hypothetical protein